MHKNILKAKKRIDKFIIETDCKYASEISNLIGTEVFVKYDNKQHTGSFKYRGSINKLLSLTKEEKKKGDWDAEHGAISLSEFEISLSDFAIAQRILKSLSEIAQRNSAKLSEKCRRLPY